MDIVHQLEIQPGMSIDALVRGWSHCGFGARRLAQAAEIYERMLSGNFTKFFTLSGAMVPAGMRHVVSDLIRGGHVDVLVSTGANLVHDIIAVSYTHLDVYKRQALPLLIPFWFCSSLKNSMEFPVT